MDDDIKIKPNLQKENENFDCTNLTNDIFKYEYPKIDYDSNEESSDKMEIDINIENEADDSFHQPIYMNGNISSLNSDLSTNILQTDECKKKHEKTFIFEPQPVGNGKSETGFNFKCEKCTKAFKSADLLASHMEVHKYAPFECTDCGKTFKFKCYLKMHAQTHNKHKSYECEKCGATFRSSVTFKRHSTTFCDSYHIVCNKCNQIFRSKYRFIDHNKNVHGVEKDMTCVKCELKFLKKTDLAKHLKQCLYFQKYVCNICQMKMQTKQSLMDHINFVHINPNFLKCDKCDKCFKNDRYLKRHITVMHRKPGRFNCNECRKIFRTKKALFTHVSDVHKKIRNFECDVCSKVFKRKKCFITHLSTHNSSLDYKCDVCECAFSTEILLLQHVNIHNTHDTYFGDVLKYEKLKYQN